MTVSYRVVLFLVGRQNPVSTLRRVDIFFGAKMARVRVGVGGLWPAYVVLPPGATWQKVKELISEATGITPSCQRLWGRSEGREHDLELCGLEEGDELECEWELMHGDHPLHSVGTAPRRFFR